MCDCILALTRKYGKTDQPAVPEALFRYAREGRAGHLRGFALAQAAKTAHGGEPRLAEEFRGFLAEPELSYWAIEGLATTAGEDAYPDLVAIAAGRSELNVILESADKKIPAIQQVRLLCSESLAEARDLVLAAPSMIMKKVDEETAERVRTALEGVGAAISVRSWYPTEVRANAAKQLAARSGQRFDRDLPTDPGCWTEEDIRADEIVRWSEAGFPRGSGYV